MDIWQQRRDALDKVVEGYGKPLVSDTSSEKPNQSDGEDAPEGKGKEQVNVTQVTNTGVEDQTTKNLGGEQAGVVQGTDKGEEGPTEPAPAPPTENLAESNLNILTQYLLAFSRGQFDFFYNGFDPNNSNSQYGRLNPSREWPKEYVFRVIQDQVAEDLEVIRRATEQRRSPELADNLAVADKLVWSALKPVIGPGNLVNNQQPKLYEQRPIPEKTIAMSYFQKSASIRVIPYARVALIGLPFTAGAVPRDYLSIPHEVGHYVYRHGKVYVNPEGDVVDDPKKGTLQSLPQVLGRKLLNQIKRNTELEKEYMGNKLWKQANDKWKKTEPNPELGRFGSIPRYVYRWKEEIFADVYSYLVGGPVVALSLQDLMRQTSRSSLVQTPGEYLYGQFTEDDGVHPVPVLRPYVGTITLRAMSKIFKDNQLSSWADELDKRWQDSPQVQEDIEFRTRYTTGTSAQYISVAKTVLEVYRVVMEVLTLLPVINFVESRWSGNTEDKFKNADLLYIQFEESGFKRLERTDIGTRKLEEPPKENEEFKSWAEEYWKNWVKEENFFPGFTDGLPSAGTIIEPGKVHTLEGLEQEPRHTWNHVFLASGWATRPHGAGSQGILFPKNWRGQSDGGGSGGY